MNTDIINQCVSIQCSKCRMSLTLPLYWKSAEAECSSCGQRQSIPSEILRQLSNMRIAARKAERQLAKDVNEAKRQLAKNINLEKRRAREMRKTERLQYKADCHIAKKAKQPEAPPLQTSQFLGLNKPPEIIDRHELAESLRRHGRVWLIICTVATGILLLGGCVQMSDSEEGYLGLIAWIVAIFTLWQGYVGRRVFYWLSAMLDEWRK